jgi:hypothetical protein
MADMKVTLGKAGEAAAVGGSAGFIALQAGQIIDTYLQSKGIAIQAGTGFVLITTVIPAIYKGVSNWLKHRKTK